MMVICYTQEGGYTGVHLMARLFEAGWETLEPLRYCECGLFTTTLCLPEERLAKEVEEP